MDAPRTVPEPTPPRRRKRAGVVALTLFALIVVVIAGVIAYALSESGLEFLVARVVAQSGGRLSIEGASGSVASTMRFSRLTWRGGDTTVEARDVIVDWEPGALWNSRVEIRSLGASRVSIALKPSAGATPPPTDLALPLEVSIANLAINELEWRAGPRGGRITGLALGYRGGAREHVVQGLRLGSEFGALTGDVTLGTHAPLPLAGTLGIAGDGPLAGARLDATLGGTLPRIAVGARGAVRGAELVADASLTPFTTAPLERVHATLRHVDAHAFVDALPTTAVDVVADVEPAGTGFAGTAVVTNQVPGPLDADRLPFVELRGRYRWQPTALDVDDLVATLPGDGTVTGRATIALGAPKASANLALALRNVDPRRLNTKLVSMRLAGQLTGQVGDDRQVVAGTLSDGSNSARFDATIANRKVDLPRIELATAGGRLAGRAALALDGARAFEAHVVASHFDPSRFVVSAPAALDGSVDVRGTLGPALALHADAVVQPGSRYGNVAVAGRAAADVAWPRVRNIALDGTAGSAHVTLAGDVGAVGDRLAFDVSAPKVADVAPLLPATMRPTAGALEAKGTLRLEPGGPGGDVRARAQGLRLADGASATTIVLEATVAPGGAAARPVPIEARRFDVKAAATALSAGGRALDDAAVDVSGTLGEHALRVRGRSEGLTVDAAAHGRLVLARELAASTWDGRVETLDTSGRLALHLRGPASVSVARDRQQVADAHLDIADGRADIVELRVVGGRVTTRGSFTGVPLTSILALAGTTSPMASTLVLGGDWQIDAAPQLNGRFAVRRERGDLFTSETVPDASKAGLALGLTTLELAGTLRNDALAARAQLRSARAGDAEGEVTIGSVAGATEGHLATSAPLTARLDASLASLTPLQPLLGTQAVVNGRLRAALRATGTLGAPKLTGTLDGDTLRIDAPQYGIHVTDGLLRARLAEDRIAVDELSFAGGDGRFTASGRLALPGRGSSEVTWKAEHFRVADRPDLRLVVAGEGTLGFAERRVALKGMLRVEDGHVEYEASPPGHLGPDVVVKGRAVGARRDTMATLPLSLDLDVDLGRSLTFSGEGLDAALAGRVNVSTAPDGTLRGRGTIRTQYGTYYAFGQKLTIDRGRVIFDGPLDNPALDVVALRKNLAVEAGVEVTGTVKVPLVRITSSPPVPENEALAWLITGQGPSGTGRSDYAALSAAAGALLGRNGKPISTRIAQSIGLDDISLQSSGTATGTSTNPVANQVVVLGKRISDRLTLGYEQGLSFASGALRLEYALTRTVTLRAEAGTVSAIGLYFRRSFE